MTKKLDLTKPVQTKNGSPVRILCTDRVGERPVVGLIMSPDGGETGVSWTLEGRKGPYYGTDAYDLVNVPEEVTLWFNVYRRLNGEVWAGSSWPSKEDAIAGSGSDRIDTVSITIPL